MSNELQFALGLHRVGYAPLYLIYLVDVSSPLHWGQLMQQTGLHRTTQWRHRAAKTSKQSRYKGSGRGRRTKAQDLESIGLAAWILDSLRDNGYCYTWQLSEVSRVSSQDLANEEVLHNEAVKLKCGSDKTVEYLQDLDLPAGLLLYAAAFVASRYGMEPRDHRTLQRYFKDKESANFPTAAQTQSLRSSYQQEGEDKRMKFQGDRQILTESKIDQDCEVQRKRSQLHLIAELRGCGLSKQTCSKWRNNPRLKEAQRAFGPIFKGNLPHLENKSQIFVIPVEELFSD